MEFSEAFLEKLKNHMQQEWFVCVCKKLNIYDINKSFDENLEYIKEYILLDLKGKHNIDKAIKRFWDSMEVYKEGEDFARWNNEKNIPEGFIKTDLILPINNETGFYSSKYVGIRTSRMQIRSGSEMNILKNKQKD